MTDAEHAPHVCPVRAVGEALERLLQEKYANYRVARSGYLEGMVDGLDLAIDVVNDHLPDDEPPIEGALTT